MRKRDRILVIGFAMLVWTMVVGSTGYAIGADCPEKVQAEVSEATLIRIGQVCLEACSPCADPCPQQVIQDCICPDCPPPADVEVVPQGAAVGGPGHRLEALVLVSEDVQGLGPVWRPDWLRPRWWKPESVGVVHLWLDGESVPGGSWRAEYRDGGRGHWHGHEWRYPGFEVRDDRQWAVLASFGILK